MTHAEKTRSSAVTVALAVLLCAAACGEVTDSLTITVVKAGSDLGDNPLENVDTLRIHVLDDGYLEITEPLEFNPFDGSAELSQLLNDRQTGVVRFQAEGLNGGVVVARGGTAYLTLGDGDLAIALFMGRINTFHPTMTADRVVSDLPFPLAGHTVTRLKDGRVLIVGGATLDTAAGITDISNRAIVYDPNTGEFNELPSQLRIRRAFHTATLLKASTLGGPQQVLIAGGISLISGERMESSKLAEIFDPVSMSFTGQLLEMRQARYGHTATLLISGDVLVAGGASLAAQQLVANRPSPDDLVMDTVHANADLFQFGAVPLGFAAETIPMDAARMFHVAGRGNGSLVMLAGGQSHSEVHLTTEVYNPGVGALGSFGDGTPLLYPRTHATLTRLSNNDLLIVGGLTTLNDPSSATNRVERFILGDTGQGTTEEVPVESRLINRRWRHHTALMSDGQRVLVSGGLDTSGFTLNTAELVSVGSPTEVPPDMADGRVYHASTRLLSGDVIFVGGVSLSPSGGADPLLGCTIYTPALVGD
ncbi:MAG: kelch repeat-containing protein [bacterium]